MVSATGRPCAAEAVTPRFVDVPVSGSAWMHLANAALVATDFVFIASDLSQTPEHPDFSAQGRPIEFGFVRAITTGPSAFGARSVGGIDNWQVTVHR